mmetsp:Transcript_428/g.613  ORF Transcript_428/g.613 Transcript_428/m.613 type:complete len:447 (-) Transcript_428:60-1400(-)
MLSWFFFVLSCFSTCSLASRTANDPAEILFHEAVAAFQRIAPTDQNRWKPWYDITQSLLPLIGEYPLEVVGAFEESILVIERETIGQADDGKRDLVLGGLYYGYAKVLTSLNSDQCIQLALSPHNLLIGSETTDKKSPSTKLCVENAENSLRNAASLDATNQDVDDLLKVILGESEASSGGVHKRKPKEFVAELFDSFAESFDEKLANLGYKVPELVGYSAQEFLRQDDNGESKFYGSALDAGCGTGLTGRYLRPLVEGPLLGVDASQKMLDIASNCTISHGCGLREEEDSGKKNLNTNEDKRLYDGLFALDLEDMTIENTLGVLNPLPPEVGNKQKIDLITAADVLVYFGKLNSLFQTFAKISSVGAALVFSCERASNEEAPLGWRLLPSGRFAHTKSHAVEAAESAGYKLVAYKEIVPRMEKGEEVKGHLFTFSLRHTGTTDEL